MIGSVLCLIFLVFKCLLFTGHLQSLISTNLIQSLLPPLLSTSQSAETQPEQNKEWQDLKLLIDLPFS